MSQNLAFIIHHCSLRQDTKSIYTIQYNKAMYCATHLMTHCHFPEGEWSATVYCPVFAHIAPTEGEDTESERREWGVSPHILQREMGHHKKGEVIGQRVQLQEGREMITFMRTEHSIDCTQIQDILLH